MQTVAFAAVPVFCGYKVAESIGVLVCCHLRISGCAGGEEHQCGLITCGRILRTVEFTGETRVLGVEITPAVAGTAYHDEMLNLRTVLGSQLCIVCSGAVSGTYKGFYACGIVTVFEVVFLQLVGCRDGNCTELMECYHTEPELVVTLQD